MKQTLASIQALFNGKNELSLNSDQLIFLAPLNSLLPFLDGEDLKLTNVQLDAYDSLITISAELPSKIELLGKKLAPVNSHLKFSIQQYVIDKESLVSSIASLQFNVSIGDKVLSAFFKIPSTGSWQITLTGKEFPSIGAFGNYVGFSKLTTYFQTCANFLGNSDDFQIKALDIVFNPKTSKLENFSIRGIVRFWEQNFNIFLSGPEINCRGQVSILKPISFSDLSKRLDFISLNNLSSITIDQLSLNINPSSMDFKVMLGLNGEWNIQVGDHTLTMTASHVVLIHSNTAFTGSLIFNGNFFNSELEGKILIGPGSNGELEIEGQLGDISFNELVESLCGPIDIIPDGFPELVLKSTVVSIKKNTDDVRFACTAEVDHFGTISISLEKDKKWGIVGKLELNETWKLSDLSDSLQSLDLFDYLQPKLIVSTLDGPASIPEAKAGITFEAICTSNHGPIKDLCQTLQLPALNAKLLLAKNLTESDMILSIETDLAVGEALVFSGLGFSVKGSPFGLGFYADLAAHIDNQQLNFVVSADLSGEQSILTCEMDGDWHNPFGVEGLVLEDTVFSISFGAVPGFGLAGALAFNKKDKLTLACSLVGGGAPELLLGSYTGKITFADVVGLFSKEKLPKSFKSYFIQDFVLGMVTNPLGVQLGTKSYPFGNSIKGILGFEGLLADIAIKSSVDSFSGHGKISPMVLDDGHVIITDLDGKNGPEVDFDIRPLQSTLFYISGQISVYETGIGSQLKISEDSYQFSIRAKLFDAFMGQVDARANYGSIFNASFAVDVTLEGDFFEYLQTEVVGSLTAEAKKAKASVSKASSDVIKAKTKVAGLEITVQKAKQKAGASNAAAQKKLDTAQNNLKKASVLVQSLSKAIENAKAKAEKRNEATNSNISKAQKKVNAAQGVVTSRTTQIKKKESDAKYYDNKRYSKKIKSIYKVTSVIPPKGYWKYKTVQYAKTADKLKATGLWTDAKTMRTDLAAKITLLNAAKASLKLVKKVNKVIPVDTDPDVILQKGKLQTATHSLAVYNQVLADLKKATIVVSVDLAPEVILNQGLLDAANLVLDAAQKSLDQLSKGLGSVVSLGETVQSTSSFIKVLSAGFGGQLGATSGGSVSLNVDLLVQGKKQAHTLAFDFKNPIAMVGDLVAKLLKD